MLPCVHGRCDGPVSRSKVSRRMSKHVRFIVPEVGSELETTAEDGELCGRGPILSGPTVQFHASYWLLACSVITASVPGDDGAKGGK
jgi:hypothetical protein